MDLYILWDAYTILLDNYKKGAPNGYIDQLVK